MSLDLGTLAPLFHDYLTLKKLRRTGWQMRGIRDCESLADHCFGVSFLTMLLADVMQIVDLNREKALRMAMVHEIAECRVGDIPFPALEFLNGKSTAEQAAARTILAPAGKAAGAYIELFEEFESGSSLESRFVKAVDKLEMLITAAEYERIGFLALGDFWENDVTFKAFEQFPDLEKFADHLRKQHRKPPKS